MALALKEAQCLAYADELGKGIEASIRSLPKTEISVEHVIAIQRSDNLFREISKTLTKGLESIQAELARAIKNS